MDAGVPIESPVGGISIGMMSIEDKYVLLTDIIGLEDFSGDMDFKVAGTEKGITAIQLDVKIPGLTDQQVKETLERAKTARTQILAKITSILEHSREKLSEYAPKIEQIQIPVDKIGEVIGPGGRVIKNIIATTGATVDVEDDGRVTITGTTDESVQAALNTVQGITREVQVGELFEGPVKRILPFGAFVEILPGKEGMVHVSHMAEGFVKSPEDVVQLDQAVKVKVIEIDDQGRINLTMRLDEDPGAGRRSEGGRPERRGFGGGGDRPERRSFGGGERRSSFGRGPRRDDRREVRDSSGPSDDHPLSRQFRRERSEQRIQSKKPGYRR